MVLRTIGQYGPAPAPAPLARFFIRPGEAAKPGASRAENSPVLAARMRPSLVNGPAGWQRRKRAVPISCSGAGRRQPLRASLRRAHPAAPRQRKRGKRNADRRVVLPSASANKFTRFAQTGLLRAARACEARSPVGVPLTALTGGAFARSAQLQARLPGTRQDVRSETLHPTGGERPRAAKRALPAPACPSPVAAPHGPVVVPASMMPGAAPARVASPRGSTALAPHHGSHPECVPRLERDLSVCN